MQLTSDDRAARLSACTTGIFHLELRDSYGVATEDDHLTRWLSGNPAPYDEVAAQMRRWTDRISAITRTGRTVRRVRVITEPHTDYIAFEYHDTPHNLAAGEDIRWLPRHRLPAGVVLPVGGNDWWLVDDADVIVGYFDADGRPSSRELITDPGVVADCVRVRDLLWGMATPHADYRPPAA